MTAPNSFHYFDHETLLGRLSNGLKRHPQEVVFVIGAPLSIPFQTRGVGVPGVDGMIDLIRQEFIGDADELAAFERTLNAAGERRYQSAFVFLQGRRGQQAANRIVRSAVRSARLPGSVQASPEGADDSCRLLEADIAGWAVNPGTESLARLVTEYPGRFGKSILTTNFDPLVEVALARAGGHYFRTILHSDGNLSQTEAAGCHVVHLHGYWYGSDTLHTSRQLGQSRPRLQASLVTLLRSRAVVVCGYGGWDDAFTEAMMNLVRDDTAYPEILWTFFEKEPVLSDRLAAKLSPGIDRGRVALYSGIDCNDFFPRLHSAWRNLEDPAAPLRVSQSNPVRITPVASSQSDRRTATPTIVEGDAEDRPPVVEICVGRGDELDRLKATSASTVFITGLGGQGKSTVAAEYFALAQTTGVFDFFVWRDCKEETERFENQLASVAEKLSDGMIRGVDLANQNAATIIETLLGVIRDLRVLFVFDNVDNYVDLDTAKLTGCPHLFVTSLHGTAANSRVVFTCRPSVVYSHAASLSCPLAGISIAAASELFEARGAKPLIGELHEAHALTKGHAFWLDLLAIQAAKQPGAAGMAALLAQIKSGRGAFLPENTLRSIWETLREREQMVLRSMAETVKPATEAEIEDYLRPILTYNKVMKSLKALRALNLVVVKKRPRAADVLELHPLVRQFIRDRFPPKERFKFIQAIIAVYRSFRGIHIAQLKLKPTFATLQYWTQNAELDIAAGRFQDAFATLAEAGGAFESSGYTREFCRVVRILLSSTNWIQKFATYKDFDFVFRTHVSLLSFLGEHAEVDQLLDDYAKTVPSKDVRYVTYVDMRAHSEWLRGNYDLAVRWGKVGEELTASGVETPVDVRHTLALAQRDSGHPNDALQVFLKGESLASVTDPEELNEERGGPYYGNIGRCLHLMGQVDGALVCYQKSALLIERLGRSEHVLNQGYIRLWIGELLVARGRLKLAEIFVRAAASKWKRVFPARGAKARELARQLQARVPNWSSIDESTAEEVCLDWIRGLDVEAGFR